MQIVQNFSTGKKFSEVRLKNMLDSRIFSLEHSFICVCKFDANLQSTMSPKRSTPQAFGGGMSSTAAPPIRVCREHTSSYEMGTGMMSLWTWKIAFKILNVTLVYRSALLRNPLRRASPSSAWTRSLRSCLPSRQDEFNADFDIPVTITKSPLIIISISFKD